MKSIQFHLDENVDHSIAEGLRRRGITVTTTSEAGLIGASDEEQVAYAMAQNRVIFTHDADFLRLHRQGIEHSGIVYVRQGNRSIGEILRALVRLQESLTRESMIKHLEFI